MQRISFLSPDKLLETEKNSKLLHPDSALAFDLNRIRVRLKEEFKREMDCRPLHTDLSTNLPRKLDRKTKISEIQRRAKILHGAEIDIHDQSNWGFTGVGDQAFVLWFPELDAGTERAFRPHVTVAYFRLKGKKRIPETVQTKIRQKI